jgi:hypothetical protein
MAIQAGLKKGGAAKGELVLAIYELANCFRNGWGIEKDPVAAKQVCSSVQSLRYQGLGGWLPSCFLDRLDTNRALQRDNSTMRRRRTWAILVSNTCGPFSPGLSLDSVC